MKWKRVTLQRSSLSDSTVVMKNGARDQKRGDDPPMGTVRMQHHFCNFPAKHTRPESNYEETSD